jgi:hypothetical protein
MLELEAVIHMKFNKFIARLKLGVVRTPVLVSVKLVTSIIT